MECGLIKFSGHAIRRMFERHVQEEAVVSCIRNGEIIAEYPDDNPYPSVLILGWTAGTPLHVVVGVDSKANEAYVITVYIPNPEKWREDFKTRRKT